MTNYKTATHQNLSVWSRRLEIEIKDLDRAADLTFNMFGMHSRRAVLTYFAIRVFQVTMGLPARDPLVWYGAQAMGHVAYDAIYGGNKMCLGHYSNFVALLSDYESKGLIDKATRLNITKFSSTAVELIELAVSSRNDDRAKAKNNLANIIIDQARGYAA